MRIFFVPFILLVSIVSHAQPEIIVRSENLVEGNKITFGDIAELKNFSKDIKEQISNLEISDAPNAGEVRKFTNFGLSEVLRYNIADISNINVTIPQEIMVRQKHFSLKKEDIEKSVSVWVEGMCSPCDIRFSNISLPNFAGVSGAATWELVKNGNPPKGSFYLAINIKDKNTEPKRLWVSGDIRIFKKVPVLQKLLSSGIRIQKEDYKIESRDVTFAIDTVPTEMDLLGSELNRTVSANEVIWKSTLKRRLVMQKGQPVNVVMKADGWNVNVKGIAQSFGYIGDMMRVLNPMTNRYMFGVVVDEATIEVK